jgi:YidC/Oxa1 family membrane protein insertase
MLNVLYTIIIFPIVQIIEFVFVLCEKVFKETSVSIIGISVAVSLLCLPLYIIAEKWQQLERDTQKRLKSKIDKIKAVFKGDEQYMILSTYYRQNHYHPIYAMRSTFGLLIQIPFFIAAYSFLSNLDALRGVSFLSINDLGAPDNMVSTGLLTINILPVVMTLINIIAGAVYLRGFPIKDKVQLYGMAAVFLVLLYNSPAGLVLYWTLNNVFSLIKNLYYAIKSKWKNTVIFTGISAFCVFLVYYVLVVHRGNIKVRVLIAVLSGVVAVGVWVFPLLINALTRLASARQLRFPQYTKKELLLVFLSTCFAFWALYGLFLPSMLIASSPQEFSFIDNYTTPLFFVGNTVIQAFGFFMFWSMCLYALFLNHVKLIGTLLYLVCFTGALCNVFLFSGNYGLISVTLEFTGSVGHNNKEILINLLVLLAPTLAVVFLFIKKCTRILVTVPLLCLCSFLGISMLNMVSINSSYREIAEFYRPSDAAVQTVEPIFHLTKTGKNVVVIMLDRAISVFMPYILEEAPELNEIYSGFVFYPNTVSFNGYTGIGAPPIFGGYESTPLEINKRTGVPLRQKHNEALMMMPRIFSEAGYAVTATDSPYANYTQKPDMRIYDELPTVRPYITDSAYTDVWIKEHEFKLPLTSEILKRSMSWYSFLRASPLALREGIYMKGDWCAPIANRSLKLFLNGYCPLDYLPELTGFTTNAENTALFMVNNTTHEGASLQAPDYVPAITVTDYGSGPFPKEKAYHINIAAIKRLADWFLYLKNEGVYDNTRIIIVSDHGPEPNFVTKIGLPFNVDQFNSLLMVKDFTAIGSLRTDNTFMSTADVPTIALRGLITNPVNPYTGNAITDEAKKEPLYIAISGSVHIEDSQATQFGLNPKEDYYVHTNIFDPANWEKAEK